MILNQSRSVSDLVVWQWGEKKKTGPVNIFILVPEGSSGLMVNGSGLATEGFPDRIPDQAGLAKVPLGKAPNTKIAHAVVCTHD